MIAAILLVAVWLLLALLLRAAVPLFAAVRIPASLLAGGIGLVVLQLPAWLGGTAPRPGLWPAAARWMETTTRWSDTLQAWPGVLIAVVFAGLLLARPPRTAGGGRDRGELKRVGREGLMVWIIVLGQTTVGMWITWLIIQPLYNLPSATGMLIETGFAGGHGTAAAMGIVFEHPSIDLDAGLDLGLLMATAGLAFGLVSGIVWINLAIWMGWYTPEDRPLAAAKSDTESDASSPPATGPPLGTARLDGNVLDPLLLQAMWLMLAFGIGLALQEGVRLGGLQLDEWRGAGFDAATAEQDVGRSALRERMSVGGVLGSFPLFIYTLFGGAIVRSVLQWSGQGRRIDPHTIARLVAAAMDVLVVAAVATLNLTAVAALWVPFTCLFLGGAVWASFCLLGLSRLILPSGLWFPLGLINYGMSTGTTATGFVLLRVVDPNLRSGAGEVYALAAPLSAPFIGGGMLTIALPLLVLPHASSAVVTLVLTSVLLVLIGVGVGLRRREEGGG
ncbi:sodium/glutamate symporter family protein [Roseimaritima sediminicola]|uniref:sodium:glutamate symporter n=1 Tax=Roseimaritima sediminicola TaxID=2662066 RepID=UPI0012984F93|nr:sodium:glutamate symporter [Roseimaritima sediminicola]